MCLAAGPQAPAEGQLGRQVSRYRSGLFCSSAWGRRAGMATHQGHGGLAVNQTKSSLVALGLHVGPEPDYIRLWT